jgi:hypothetical protein
MSDTDKCRQLGKERVYVGVWKVKWYISELGCSSGKAVNNTDFYCNIWNLGRQFKWVKS